MLSELAATTSPLQVSDTLSDLRNAVSQLQTAGCAGGGDVAVLSLGQLHPTKSPSPSQQDVLARCLVRMEDSLCLTVREQIYTRDL